MGGSRASRAFRPMQLRSDGRVPVRRRVQLLQASIMGILLALALTGPGFAQEAERPHHLSVVPRRGGGPDGI